MKDSTIAFEAFRRFDHMWYVKVGREYVGCVSQRPSGVFEMTLGSVTTRHANMAEVTKHVRSLRARDAVD